MRRLGIILAFCISAVVFCPTGNAFAQGAPELPAPGITPDSPFYFWDDLAEQFTLRFTFREEVRVEKALRYAEERLAEMNSMMAKNDVEATICAMDGYTNRINFALRAMEALGNDESHIAETVALAMSQHTAILANAADEIPEGADAIMTQTRERATICQQTALRLLAQGDPERASQIRLMLMVRQHNSFRVMTGENEGFEFQGKSDGTGSSSNTITDDPGIVDDGYSEAQSESRVQNQIQAQVQAKVQASNQLTFNNPSRLNSMFGESPDCPPSGKENSGRR